MAAAGGAGSLMSQVASPTDDGPPVNDWTAMQDLVARLKAENQKLKQGLPAAILAVVAGADKANSDAAEGAAAPLDGALPAGSDSFNPPAVPAAPAFTLGRMMSLKQPTKSSSKTWSKVAMKARLMTLKAQPHDSGPTATWRCKKHLSFLHDLFISYRVATEGKYALALANALSAAVDPEGRNPDVFLDAQCLNDGEDWERGFLNGLGGSSVVLLLISKASLEGIIANAPTRQDNVLLEYESALDRLASGKNRVLPLFVSSGTYTHTEAVAGAPPGRKFVPSFMFPRMEEFADAPHACPKSTSKSIRETMAQVFRLQGIPVDADDPQMAVAPIMSFLNEFDVVVHPGTSIMAGIQRCRPGGRLLIRPGTYREDVELAEGRSVHLFGQRQVVIDGVVTSRSSESASIDGFQLRSLVVSAGALVVRGCLLASEDATKPAALVGAAATPTFTRCAFQNCAGGALRAQLGGVAAAAAAAAADKRAVLRLEDCELRGCGGDAAIVLEVLQADAYASCEISSTSINASTNCGLALTCAAPGLSLNLVNVKIDGAGGAGVAVEVGDVRDCRIALDTCTVRATALDGVRVANRGRNGILSVTETVLEDCEGSGISLVGNRTHVMITNCVVRRCNTAHNPAPGADNSGGRSDSQFPDCAVKAEAARAGSIDLQCCKSVAISGCTVSACLAALCIESVQACEVSNNRLFNCELGIVVSVFAACIIEGNTIRDCTAAGMSLAAGLGVAPTIVRNRILRNHIGVLLWRGAVRASEAVTADTNSMSENMLGDIVCRAEVYAPPSCPLEWALGMVPDGGTLLLGAGAFPQRLSLVGAKAVLVRARRPGETSLRPPPAFPGAGGAGSASEGPCVHSSCTAACSLEGLLIEGAGQDAAVMVSDGALLLRRCTLKCRPSGHDSSDARLGDGVGLLVTGGRPTAHECSIVGCETGARVAGETSGLELRGCSLVSCGVGLDVRGPHVEATRCRFRLNTVSVALTKHSAGSEDEGLSGGLPLATPETATWVVRLTECVTELVMATGSGARLEMEGCKLLAGGMDVSDGATAAVSRCSLMDCSAHVRGHDSALTLHDCEVVNAQGSSTQAKIYRTSAQLRMSGVLVESGGQSDVVRTSIRGYSNGVTVTDGGSRCRLDGVTVENCHVSGVNAIKGASLDIKGGSIARTGMDGILLSNGATALLADVNVAECKRCALSIMPGCEVRAAGCMFERSAIGVHVGGRLARWFSPGDGWVGDMLRTLGVEAAVLALPGLCCLWRGALTASSVKLTSCVVVDNNRAGVIAWMASPATLSLRDCDLRTNAHGVVLSAPRGHTGSIRGLARLLEAHNVFTANAAGGISVRLMRYAGGASVDATVPLRSLSFWVTSGCADAWMRIASRAPSGRHEENHVFAADYNA